MQLRWTAEAANDLEPIADYLLTHTPDRAPELVPSTTRPSAPLTYPNRGRPGKKAGDVIYVVLILHGAQKWP
jgi:plasmid stabilization system protein ParE